MTMIQTASNNRPRTVASGVILLSLSGILVKVVGMLFKIPLTNMIGESGMGYFSSAYMIYSFFYVISTAGLPLAISILVSGARADNDIALCKRIMRVSLLLFTAVGGMLCLMMFFGAGLLSGLISNSGAAYSVAAISPTVFFVSVISVYRGYFQGFQYMFPTALSQMIEAAGKLAFGLAFARAALSAGADAQTVAAFAVLGISAATGLSMLSLIILKRLFKDDRSCAGVSRVGSMKLVGKLIKLALPISASSAVMSLSGMLDLAIVMRRLQSSGYTEELSNALYGNYSSLAVPLFNLPSVLITPIACSTVPYIAKALASRDGTTVRVSSEKAIKYALLIALPSSLGLFVFSEPVLKLIFNDSLASSAAMSLSLLSTSVVFVALSNVTVSILQACGITVAPVITMGIGALVKLVSAWFLIGEFGLNGTPLSTLACYVTITALDLILLDLLSGIRIKLLKLASLPLFGALIAVGGAYALYLPFFAKLGSAGCLAAIATAVAVYFSFMLITGYVSREELSALPVFRRIISITQKRNGKENDTRQKGGRTRAKGKV